MFLMSVSDNTLCLFSYLLIATRAWFCVGALVEDVGPTPVDSDLKRDTEKPPPLSTLTKVILWFKSGGRASGGLNEDLDPLQFLVYLPVYLFAL